MANLLVYSIAISTTRALGRHALPGVQAAILCVSCATDRDTSRDGRAWRRFSDTLVDDEHHGACQG